jgi:TM2 domain-containing membrane protein YozV
MFCQNCGTNNTDWSQACMSCGRQLQAVNSPGSPVGGYAAGYAPARIPAAPLKNPGVAAVLSFFFVGLGQIYNGEIGKGLVFMFCGFVSGLMMFILIGFVTTPILWIFGIIDAYKTAERINGRASSGY